MVTGIQDINGTKFRYNIFNQRFIMTLDEWIVTESVGVSSKTMWACLKNIDVTKKYGDKPYDPGDFSRCYKLVKKCNLTFPELYVISEKLPYWKPYIDNWHKLTEMYEENVKWGWDKKKRDEIGMYEYMRVLREASDAIRFSN